MTPAEILKAAREVISEPSRWTTEMYARQANGDPTLPTDKKAVCWCLVGAIHKTGDGQPIHVIEQALRLLSPVMDGNMTVFNDTHSHEEVLATFDKAIELAEAVG